MTKVWDDPAVFSIEVDLPQNPLWYLNVYVIMTVGSFPHIIIL